MPNRKKEIAVVLGIGVVVLLVLSGYGALLWAAGRGAGMGSLLVYVSLGVIAFVVLGFLAVLVVRIREIRSDNEDHRDY